MNVQWKTVYSKHWQNRHGWVYNETLYTVNTDKMNGCMYSEILYTVNTDKIDMDECAMKHCIQQWNTVYSKQWPKRWINVQWNIVYVANNEKIDVCMYSEKYYAVNTD